MHCILSFFAQFWIQEKVRYIPYYQSLYSLMVFVGMGCLLTVRHMQGVGFIVWADQGSKYACSTGVTLSKDMGLCSYHSTSFYSI
jgi:hypothetical protein